MADREVSAKSYIAVYVALLMLLAATIGVSFVHLGSFNAVAALAIAVVKAILIILYFMHIRHSARTRWIFAGIGFFWLAILLALATTDYLTRGRIPLPPGWE
jgi:cytochrome c oxidase subunit 4